MITLQEKFKALGAENAPGQEVRQDSKHEIHMRGEKLDGVAVDFSHGDVDAFPPTPEVETVWKKGFELGGAQAYTEYRGQAVIREGLANRLGQFTGHPIIANKELIITPGTQGALFLAMGSLVTVGTKVAIVEPDYFANRKLVKFFNGELVPIGLDYLNNSASNGIDLRALEHAFKKGTSVLVFSTPNNPTGHVYSRKTLQTIVALANKYEVSLIVDQLYSRMLYSGEQYTHLCALDNKPKNLITIMGPSKTESLSGFRLGVAFGTPELIERMERLQAIVSLRAAGYNQTALHTWFKEPDGWMENRVRQHEAIRDDLLHIFRNAHFEVATPQAGSYLFPKLPTLDIDLLSFVRLLRIQAQVTVTPGTEFGPSFTNSIRLNFSQDHAAALDAAKRIVKMVDLYRS